MYNFGFYHPRKWLRTLLPATAAFVVAVAIWRKTTARVPRVLAAITGVVSLRYAGAAASKLFRPPPWRVDGERIDNLAERLSFESTDRVLDVGCGTGRSLVALAPHLPTSCPVTGLDSYESDVIFGNTPARARSNTQEAGLEASIVAGDATTLPFADDSHDVVIVSQVLHDLSAEESRRILEECRRICAPDGTLGSIELPLVDDSETVSDEYWPDEVRAAGFDVATVDHYPWIADRQYVVLTATPESA